MTSRHPPASTASEKAARISSNRSIFAGCSISCSKLAAMSLNENKHTYGTVPAVEENSGAKGSRRNLVVGLVRPRARKSIHTVAFMSSHRALRHRRDVCSSQAAAACFALGFAVASVGPTQGLRGTALSLT